MKTDVLRPKNSGKLYSNLKKEENSGKFETKKKTKSGKKIRKINKNKVENFGKIQI